MPSRFWAVSSPKQGSTIEGIVRECSIKQFAFMAMDYDPIVSVHADKQTAVAAASKLLKDVHQPRTSDNGAIKQDGYVSIKTVGVPPTFWLITKPTPTSQIGDICVESSFTLLAGQLQGGFPPIEIVGVYGDKQTAVATASRLLEIVRQASHVDPTPASLGPGPAAGLDQPAAAEPTSFVSIHRDEVNQNAVQENDVFSQAPRPMKRTLQRETARFSEFAAEVARERSDDAFNKLTDMGISQYHPVGKHGRYWVTGYLHRHTVEALLSPRHAEQADMELESSRITKLWIRRMADHQTVAAFDRGWVLPPSTDVAREIVDYLASFLAFQAYGPLLKKSPSSHGPAVSGGTTPQLGDAKPDTETLLDQTPQRPAAAAAAPLESAGTNPADESPLNQGLGQKHWTRRFHDPKDPNAQFPLSHRESIPHMPPADHGPMIANALPAETLSVGNPPLAPRQTANNEAGCDRPAPTARQANPVASMPIPAFATNVVVNTEPLDRSQPFASFLNDPAVTARTFHYALFDRQPGTAAYRALMASAPEPSYDPSGSATPPVSLDALTRKMAAERLQIEEERKRFEKEVRERKAMWLREEVERVKKKAEEKAIERERLMEAAKAERLKKAQERMREQKERQEKEAARRLEEIERRKKQAEEKATEKQRLIAAAEKARRERREQKERKRKAAEEARNTRRKEAERKRQEAKEARNEQRKEKQRKKKEAEEAKKAAKREKQEAKRKWREAHPGWFERRRRQREQERLRAQAEFKRKREQEEERERQRKREELERQEREQREERFRLLVLEERMGTEAFQQMLAEEARQKKEKERREAEKAERDAKAKLAHYERLDAMRAEEEAKKKRQRSTSSSYYPEPSYSSSRYEYVPTTYSSSSQSSGYSSQPPIVPYTPTPTPSTNYLSYGGAQTQWTQQNDNAVRKT